MDTTHEKVVLYLGGGAMSGVFGAGVLTKLLERNFYPRIEAIYATSSGAINGAYFLARQQFSAVYYEELTHGFIKPSNFFVGFMQLLWNLYIHALPEEKARNVVNIDYAFEILRHQKTLDVKTLKEQRIPLYAKLLDVATGEIAYMDIRFHDPLMVLRASACIKPYYFSTQIIGGREYIDGSIKEPIGLSYLLDRHPRHKIVLVMLVINEPVERQPGHVIKNFLEGLVAALYPYPVSLFTYFLERERMIRKEFEIILKHHRVLLISPPSDSPSIPPTIDPTKLKITYQMGLKAAEKII